ncbi:snapalysin family zinc-dependent metalloprotease [Lentzea sp. BCCO 10_0856]|uniref:Extracellular small neutral protease n=1 Tax=Lentzea miocenica TaxID=3095431 RepID=A0ABU4T8A8_9PSEU|nr:snapalysin family zinc-dependent metalloprotease [Lentzea sp. BCCO 10_0856]MDX8034299.1 snapalysin family zinc-dependent metalloprotease [Lentzea sp. BCCO 10_0856]
MFLRKTIAVVASVAALSAGLVGTAQAAARNVTYNSSNTGQFQAAIDKGAQVWNASVANVKLVKVAGSANITVSVDNQWPRAYVSSLGRGRWVMGTQAVNEGHDTVRISAHEFGHLLGLPDRRTGLCTDLMSGASAGTSCKNPNPSAKEKAEVEANFRSAVTVQATTFEDAA